MAELYICSGCGEFFDAENVTFTSDWAEWWCPTCGERTAQPFDPKNGCWACRRPVRRWLQTQDGRRQCPHCGWVSNHTPGGDDGDSDIKGDFPRLTPEERLIGAIQGDPAIIRFIADRAQKRFENDPAPDPVVERLAALAENTPQYGEFEADRFAELIEAARPCPIFYDCGDAFTANIVAWLRGLADLVEANR